MRLVLLVLLSLLASCRANVDCNLISPKSPTMRLKRHLLCEYDPTVRPVTGKNIAINVTITISPKIIEFLDRTSAFIVHALVPMTWKDQHLTWNRDDFDGVAAIQVKSDEIWIPDFSIYNSGDMEASQVGISTECRVMYTGAVICVPSIKFNTQCDTDYTYWPYDEQRCSIRMGSWTHTGEEISFDFRRQSIDMSRFVSNKEWQVTNYTARKSNPKYECCPNETFPTLITDFELRRHAPMFRAVFITPAVVLMIITLTVLWLDSRSIERISLAAVNFICHMLCIYDLHWMLPPNGASPPHILLFHRDSLILATFAMILTTVLRKVQAAKIAPPSWIISTVSFVSSNRAGRFLLLDNSDGGNNKDLVNSNRDEESIGDATAANTAQNSDSWRKLVLIVEWLGFFIALFTYVLLIFLRVPLVQYTTALPK